MLVTFSRLILVKFVQLWNALLPMLVTPLGKEIEAKFAQLLNTSLPIVFKPLGNSKVVTLNVGKE